MSIVCIKVGENEVAAYPKFTGLSKHLDIIEVLPRKRDSQGKLLNRTMGIEGDKHYLGLNVNMSSLSDTEFNLVRNYLRKEWNGLIGIDKKGFHITKKIAKRLRYLDLSPEKRGFMGLSETTVNEINAKAELHRNKQPFDIKTINRFDIVIPFEQFAKCVKNKLTGQSLEEELQLSGKTIKDVVNSIKLK